MAYFDRFGVEFSDDRKTLVKCPKDFQGEYMIPNGVTSIGDSAFWGCSSLTSIIIPNSVTRIGVGAFGNCDSLTSVTIPNSVTSIGAYAFVYCYGLTSVTIPNSVTSIGEHAFYYCSGLTSVTIPDSVTSIKELAFNGCRRLVSIYVDKRNTFYSSKDGILYDKQQATLIKCPEFKQGEYVVPNSVISIADRAFEGCKNLTSVMIPNSVTSIGNYAFIGCKKIISPIYNDSVFAFLPTSYMGEYVIPPGIKHIAGGAFEGCSKLTSIEIPNSVISIGDRAFSGCISLPVIDNLRYADKYLVEAVDKSFSKHKIKDGTRWIGDGAFRDCHRLISVTIPNSVTSIGWRAFSGCSNLTSVTIPNSVTSIGNSAFAGCSSLTSVTIPNSVTSIGNSAFAGCSNLTKINITDIAAWCNIAFGSNDANPLYYAKHLFVNDVEVTYLVIPNGVTSIGNDAFYNSSSLTSVTIPNSVTSIGDRAFWGCSSLVSVAIGSSVTSIGGGALYDCSSLTTINVSNDNSNYSSIDGVLFNKQKTTLIQCPCGKQGAYIIPNSVTGFGDRAFSGCSSLTSVTIPNSVTSIGESAFSGCSNLTSVTISIRVISIKDYAFTDCSSLTSIVIPNSVTSIGDYAFSGCSNLTSVTIPNSVTSIGYWAFDECDNLTGIFVPIGQKERFAKMTDKKHLIVEKADVALNDRFTIRKLLYNNKITCFYHFTSRKNIVSICQHGGLYSWHYLKAHQIDIPLQGGGELSQGLDRYKGVADYVHLSFCENHPMAYHLIQEGEDIVVLKISTDVALLDGTMFTDMNAVDSQCSCAAGLEGLQKVNIAATKEKYLSSDNPLFKYKQAEILVKTHIPLEYILNIDEFL